MRLSTKVLISAWIILITVLGGLVYSAYSKLSPDSLISLLNQQVRRNYPGSELTIAKIDYGFSLDFKLSLKNLMLKRSGKILASANELELKVPWWLILLNRGNAQVNISGLDVFVVTDPEAEAQRPIEKKQGGINQHLKFELPKYLIDARYTLRAKNISVRELDGSRRLFTVSKLLVRELQFGKNSAFEMNIPISITHKEKNYSLELWLFGDVTPSLNSWSLSYRGEFKTKEILEGFEFDGLVIDGRSVFNVSEFNLISFVDLSVEREKVGSGEIKAKDNELEFRINFEKFPLEYLAFFGEEIKNPFLKKLKGEAQGQIVFKRNFVLDSAASLSAKLHFPGNFSLENDQIEGKWFLGFENEKWETSFVSAKGEISFHRRAVLDYSKGAVAQYSQEIGFNGVNLNLALRTIEPFMLVLDSAEGPYYSSYISLKKCLDADKETDGYFRYGRSPYETFYQGEILQGKSRMNINYLAKPNSQKLSLDLFQFSWNSYYLFLDPLFLADGGILNGKIEGSWNTHWTDGKWIVKVKADGLKEERGDFFSLNQKAWDHFTIDSKSVVKKTWDVAVNNSVVKLNTLLLDSADPILMNGQLNGTAKGKSTLTLIYPKNKKWKPVRKDVTEVFWKKETP